MRSTYCDNGGRGFLHVEKVWVHIMRKGQLSKASVSELIAVYREAALTHRTGSRTGGYKKANAAYKTLADVSRELRLRGADAEREFLELLKDPQIGVRGWAAYNALEFAPEQACEVLEEIASGPSSLEEMSAELVLEQWRAGTLKVFPK